MQNGIYYAPTKLYFGKDQIINIKEELKQRKVKTLIFCYGGLSIKKSGLYDIVKAILDELKIKVFELSGITPNPEINFTRKILADVGDEKIDFILAVGGGSVIDCAKSIAVSYKSGFDPWVFNAHEKVPTKALPVGVVLTIAAAGSEMSNSCVMSNLEIGAKNGFNSDLVRPVFAIEDPTYTFSVSKYQTACGITDIIMHTLERYLCDVENNYFEEFVALGLIKSVIKAGQIAYKDPKDYNARASLMLASSFSHNGLTGMGGKFYFTVHKLEHLLSAMHPDLAHGAGLAILYPAWARVVYEELEDKFAYLAKVVFGKFTAIDGIDAMERFFIEIGMPNKLSEVGFKREDLSRMASIITSCGTKKVPGFVELDYDKVMEIFEKAF